MKLRYYILIFILSFVLFLVVNAPAAKIIAMATKGRALPVQCIAPRGTLFQGGCEQLVLPSGFSITLFQWDIHPLSLIIGSLSADLQGQFAGHPVKGRISTSVGGSISGDDIRLALPASEVHKLVQQFMTRRLRMPLPLGDMNGDFNLSIDNIVMRDGFPSKVQGSLQWRKAAITLAEKVTLGNISIAVQPTDQGLVANLSNKGGQIRLKGDAQLNQKRQYQVSINLKPQASATQNIRQSLQLFAQRQGDGSFQFKQQGQLR